MLGEEQRGRQGPKLLAEEVLPCPALAAGSCQNRAEPAHAVEDLLRGLLPVLLRDVQGRQGGTRLRDLRGDLGREPLPGPAGVRQPAKFGRLQVLSGLLPVWGGTNLLAVGLLECDAGLDSLARHFGLKLGYRRQNIGGHPP